MVPGSEGEGVGLRAGSTQKGTVENPAAVEQSATGPQASMDPAVEQSMATYRLLLRVARQLRRQLVSGLEAHGLTGSQYTVLAAIPPGGIALGRLAEKASKEPASLTGIIDRLERAGWVERRPDPNDRRVVRVHTTPEGRHLAEEVTAVHPANVHRRLSALTPAEQEQLVGLLVRLQAVPEDKAPGPADGGR